MPNIQHEPHGHRKHDGSITQKSKRKEVINQVEEEEEAKQISSNFIISIFPDLRFNGNYRW